jgi:hypothetical protein
MDNDSWLFGFSQKLVADFLKPIIISVGVAVMSWLAMKGWRWVTPLLYALVTGVSLYILLYGVGPNTWIWVIFLSISILTIGILSVREHRKGGSFLEVRTPFWILPSANAVLRGIETLKQRSLPSGKAEVRILSGEEGYELAELLVRMFRLAGWSVQDNPADASAVFPLLLAKSRQGICLRGHGSVLAMGTMELYFDMFFGDLLGTGMIGETSMTISGEFISGESSQVQIEIGFRPY